MKRSAPRRRRPLAPSRRPPRPPRERELAQLWHQQIVWWAGRCCTVTGAGEDLADPATRVVAHHIVPQQLLKRLGLGHLLWDVANGLAVSERVHRRHHAGIERIERRFLPERADDFAERLGLGWYLDKHYGPVVDGGGDDARL